MKINELKSSPTSNKKNKRRGRGSGSGLGKTAGRGDVVAPGMQVFSCTELQ